MGRVSVGVLAALVWLFAFNAHADVYKEIKGCTGSIKLVIACVVIERGVEKVLDVGLDRLIAFIDKKSDGVSGDTVPSPTEAAAVRASLVPWPDFETFLISAFGKEAAPSPADARRKIGDACATKYSPICAQFGIFDPSRVTDCSGLTQDACTANLFACTWTGSACRRNGGTKELLGR